LKGAAVQDRVRGLLRSFLRSCLAGELIWLRSGLSLQLFRRDEREWRGRTAAQALGLSEEEFRSQKRHLRKAALAGARSFALASIGGASILSIGSGASPKLRGAGRQWQRLMLSVRECWSSFVAPYLFQLGEDSLFCFDARNCLVDVGGVEAMLDAGFERPPLDPDAPQPESRAFDAEADFDFPERPR
jgi:hypothetical protein